eukprot:Tbor_TRINITY_DN3686_c0_g1::TRINITY_DN3686_c0_g1_i1::g.254::m.254
MDQDPKANDTQLSHSLLLRLIEEKIWINNDDIDERRSHNSTVNSSNISSTLDYPYLQEKVFPTLIPVLHELLEEVQIYIDKSVASCVDGKGLPSPYTDLSFTNPEATSHRQKQQEKQNSQSDHISNTLTTRNQLPTHTSLSRNHTSIYLPYAAKDAMSVIHNITSVDSSIQYSGAPEVFYGPTGRVNAIVWLAQMLMRANSSKGSDRYSEHPYVILERAYGKKGISKISQ